MNQQPVKIIPFLDGWRGLAIILVLVSHFGQRPLLGWVGTFGVQLFFALSGYLMADLLFTKKVAFSDFFARRFSRVIPAFLAFVLFSYLYARTLQPTLYTAPIGELLATLTFSRTYLPSGMSIWAVQWPVGNLWSLNVEEHSYVFLALGALLTRRCRSAYPALIFLILSVVVIVGFCLFYSRNPPSGSSPWFLRSECASLGLVAAAAIRQIRAASNNPLANTVPSLLPILWVVIGIACISTLRFTGSQYVFAPISLALAINYLHCAPAIVKYALSGSVIRWFGRCSFSLYLWQQPFYNAHVEFGLHKAPAIIGALVCGALSFYLLEDPVRQYLNNKWRSRGKKQIVVTNELETKLEPV